MKRQPVNQSDLMNQEFNKIQTGRLYSDKYQEVRLFEIGLIKKFQKIHKPLLSQTRRQIIEQKLELQKKATVEASQRIKNDEYFLRYKHNPFIEKEKSKFRQFEWFIQDSTSQIKNKNNKNQYVYYEPNLIEALNNNKKKQFPYYFDNITSIKKSYQKISKNLIDKVNTKNNSSKSKIDSKNVLVKQRQMSFEQIVDIQQNSYYLANLKPFNIFQLKHKNLQNILGKDILQKHYFNFTSIVDKLSKYKFPIYRDLSKLGRDFLTQQNIAKYLRLEVLSSKQLTFKGENIDFIDIINVCSGRIDSGMAYSILFEDDAQKDGSDKSSISKNEPIYYNDNQRLKSNNFDELDYGRDENEYYLKLEHTNEEQIYRKKYDKIYENIKQNVQDVDRVLKNTIKDKKLHKKYEILIANNLKFLINLDDKQNMNVQVEKKIRSNKLDKNRRQRLKIKSLLKSVKLQNTYSQKIRQAFGDGK